MKTLLNTLKSFLFMILMGGTVVVIVPVLLVNSLQIYHFSGLGDFRYLALVPFILGVFTILWCIRDFITKGRGTPAPIDPPKKIVIDGLYRYVRNPMYVGVILILLSEAVFFTSAILFLYVLLVFSLFHTFVVIYEEPTLESKFGESYFRYRSTVPRWIIKIN